MASGLSESKIDEKMNTAEDEKSKVCEYVYDTSFSYITSRILTSKNTFVDYEKKEKIIQFNNDGVTIFTITHNTNLQKNNINTTFYDIPISNLTMGQFMKFYYKYFSNLTNKEKKYDNNNIFLPYNGSLIMSGSCIYFITTHEETRRLTPEEIKFETSLQIYDQPKPDKNYKYITVEKNGCYLLWSIKGDLPFTDINHFTNTIEIVHSSTFKQGNSVYGKPKIRCTKCCFGLEWQSCGKGSQINYICEESQDYNTCRLEEKGIHKCKNRVIEDKNFADIILQNKCIEQPKTLENITENKENLEEKQKQEKYLYECNLCGIKFKKNEILPNPHPATTPCKKFNETIVDLRFWIIKIILASLNTMISLSIINLENLPYDFTGLVTDTYEILYPINDRPLLAYNLTFLFVYMLLFEIHFLRREMCVIQMLIDNHKDRFVVFCTKKYLIKNIGKIEKFFRIKLSLSKKKHVTHILYWVVFTLRLQVLQLL